VGPPAASAQVVASPVAIQKRLAQSTEGEGGGRGHLLQSQSLLGVERAESVAALAVVLEVEWLATLTKAQRAPSTHLQDELVVLPQRWSMRDGEKGDAELCKREPVNLAHSSEGSEPLTGRAIVEDLLYSKGDGTGALVEDGVLRPSRKGQPSPSRRGVNKELTLGQ
jgi:hypothetical protein